MLGIMADEIIFIANNFDAKLELPYVDGSIRAGFPSPAQDYVDKTLDLNRDLIRHPEATFYARVIGDSMEPGIVQGDILVVDRSIDISDGSLVVCVLNGEFTVKRVDFSQKEKGTIRLVPDNPKYPIIDVTKDEQFEVWGGVRYVIHDVCGSRL